MSAAVRSIVISCKSLWQQQTDWKCWNKKNNNKKSYRIPSEKQDQSEGTPVTTRLGCDKNCHKAAADRAASC